MNIAASMTKTDGEILESKYLLLIAYLYIYKFTQADFTLIFQNNLLKFATKKRNICLKIAADLIMSRVAIWFYPNLHTKKSLPC